MAVLNKWLNPLSKPSYGGEIVQHVKLLLSLIGWVSILALQIVLMNIARFFQKSSGEPTWHRLYLLPIILSAVGAGSYTLKTISGSTQWPDFTGDTLANLCLFFAGVLLILLSSRLYEQMMGGNIS